MKVNELQREIKSLESQAAEEEENIKRLASARERAKTSFFAVMRPRGGHWGVPNTAIP